MSPDPSRDRIRVLYWQQKRYSPKSPAYRALEAAIRAEVDARKAIHGDEMQLVAAPYRSLCGDRPNVRRLHRSRPVGYTGQLRMAKANLPW